MVVSENSTGIVYPLKLFWDFPYDGKKPSCGAGCFL